MIYTLITRSINFLMVRLTLMNLKTHTFYGGAITADSVVIDLGANVGQFTHDISRVFNCVCYALEPIPNLFAQIKDSSLIKKFNYAISNTNTPIKLYLSGNAESHSMSQAIAAEYGVEGILELPAITLEKFLQQQNICEIDLLKIDIEGAEELLFNSTSDTILRGIKQITIEFHDCFPDSISAAEVEKIIKRLEALGFYSIPFSYLMPDLATCDFLFVNKCHPNLTFQHWLGFWVVKTLLNLEKLKSGFVRRWKLAEILPRDSNVAC